MVNANRRWRSFGSRRGVVHLSPLALAHLVETLMNLLVGTTATLQSRAEGQVVGGKPRRAGTFGGYDRLLAGAGRTSLHAHGRFTLRPGGSSVTHTPALADPAGSRVKPRERTQRASSDPQLKEAYAAQPEPPPHPALAVRIRAK